MFGGIQTGKLLVTNLIDHAAREHTDRELVSYWADGSLTRSSWGEVGLGARKFAQAMHKIGIKKATGLRHWR